MQMGTFKRTGLREFSNGSWNAIAVTTVADICYMGKEIVVEEETEAFVIGDTIPDDVDVNSILARVVSRLAIVENSLAELSEDLETRPGNIVNYYSTVTIEEDGVVQIDDINGYDAAYDKIIVNYNQTILRQGIDYDVDVFTNGIDLIGFTFDTGDVIQFTVIKQTAESATEGTIGTYNVTVNLDASDEDIALDDATFSVGDLESSSDDITSGSGIFTCVDI